MRLCVLLLLSGPLMVGCRSPIAETPDQRVLEQEATSLADEFVGKLKPRLKQALQTGGPAAAVDVCAVDAPEIARQLSADSGWQVTRVSLKPRNPSAAPNAWEASMLSEFDRMVEQDPATPELQRSEWVNGQYRFLRAQRAEPLCLICHGKQISPAVDEALGKHYPLDQAKGYESGQVRGAISLSWAP